MCLFNTDDSACSCLLQFKYSGHRFRPKLICTTFGALHFGSVYVKWLFKMILIREFFFLHNFSNNRDGLCFFFYLRFVAALRNFLFFFVFVFGRFVVTSACKCFKWFYLTIYRSWIKFSLLWNLFASCLHQFHVPQCASMFRFVLISGTFFARVNNLTVFFVTI